MKNKILYVKHILEDGNELLRNVFIDQFYEKETKLIKIIKNYMEILNVNLNFIENATINEIKNKITSIDTEMWQKEVEKRSTLEIYQMNKTRIEGVTWFDNSNSSSLMIRARSDSLNLNWRKKHIGQDTSCQCGYENESLKHFLLECENYAEIRKRFTFMQQPYINNKEKIIADILLFTELKEEQIDERKRYILEVWKERLKKIEEAENN